MQGLRDLGVTFIMDNWTEISLEDQKWMVFLLIPILNLLMQGNGHLSSRRVNRGEWLTLVCPHLDSRANSAYQTAHLGLVLSFHLLAPRDFDNGPTNHSVMVREDFSPSYSTGSFLETKAIITVNMESIFHVLNSLPWYSLHFMDAAIEAQRS